ncbi:metal-dependent transcriptional regulator [Pyrococcus furiosus DSM 3638]|uniref:Metal-dependent transcriptional regulator n=3 Tax=Pyrococcus furiosus TaxID=2261 RepID=A0A5C0XNN7_PYRFU|nr:MULTISPECIES: metal-dependent transcriptional regulator [Pyrococcus]AFN03639.1 iron-dependent repressor [Pyrococcus furiosus COM1]MDK2870509.1 DtxR family transcriptional regulator, Mn-dependent transcriptional regulator [Pyrococcus sp.]QEK78523.1 metal-dependent transcriptional regulator [Pyrococcus furiosus DSM 3638]
MPSKREEEYLETMYILQKNKGVIRVKDIAKMMRVKPPTVVEALKKLRDKGFVKYEEHEHILLTEKGLEVAKKTYSKHQLLTEFFINILGIPPEIAERDACQFEHYVSEVTVHRIREFISYIQQECPYALKQFLKKVREKDQAVAK